MHRWYSHVFDHHSVEIGGDTLIGGIQYHTFQVPFIQSGSNGVCPYYQSGYKGAFRQDTVALGKFILYLPVILWSKYYTILVLMLVILYQDIW